MVDVFNVNFCACGNLRRATRQLTLYYDEVLKPSGILITQFTFLVRIAAEKQLNINQLSQKLAMDQTTVTRNLAQLEKKGLIQRVTVADRRSHTVALTEQGEQALAKAIPLWEKAQAHIIENMGEERFQTALKEVAEIIKSTQ